MSTKILTPEKNVLTSNLRNNIKMMRIFFWLMGISLSLSFNVLAEDAAQKTNQNLQKTETSIQKKLEAKIENIERVKQKDKIDQASAPKPPMLSGNIDVYGGYNNTSFPHEIVVAEEATQNRPYAGIDGVINFKAITTFNDENNLRYGLTSEIDFDSFDQSNPINLMEANFIISSKSTATRMFGLHRPVTSKMNINSASFAPYSNGIMGRWQNFLKYPSFGSNANDPTITTSFITTPGSPIQSGFASQQFVYNSEKQVGVQPYEKWGGSMIGLSYISERMAGFRLGASFFPDNKASLLLQQKDLIDQKNLQILNAPSSVYLKNILAIGTNYYNYFGDVEVSFSGGIEYASAVSESYSKQDLTSYSLGLNLSYLGIMAGGSFTSYGNSLQIKGGKNGLSSVVIGNNYYYDEEKNLVKAGNAYVFDVGLGYSVDRFTINLAYLQSKYVGSEFWAGVFSFETKVTKDFINYIQVGRYEFTPPSYQGVGLPEAVKTNGYIFLVGMKYVF